MFQKIKQSLRYKKYKIVVERHFLETLGIRIDWKNPKTYNEKLQVIKLKDSTEDLWQYVDLDATQLL